MMSTTIFVQLTNSAGSHIDIINNSGETVSITPVNGVGPACYMYISKLR
jgi:hypothetical protein